jgi:iron uptake system component EfeO
MKRSDRRLRLVTRLACVFAFCLSGWAAIAAAEDQLDAVAERLRPSLAADIRQALAGAQLLHERLLAHDLEGARRAWIASRVGWERSEVFTGGFVPDLDEKIDSWPNARTGFHAIEVRLFSANDTDIANEANTLVFWLNDLDIKIRDAPLNAQRVLNGTARLAYEIGENKADGGESRFSGTSLDDMRNNIVGIGRAFDIVLIEPLTRADPGLSVTIHGEIDQLKTLLEAPDLKTVDFGKLRAVSEALVVALQKAGPEIGLRSPRLEEVAQ